MLARAIKINYVRTSGAKLPKRQWLAQVESDDGREIETLNSTHGTKELALGAAVKEIARRERAIPRCPVCGLPAHASESDDLDRHAECQ